MPKPDRQQVERMKQLLLNPPTHTLDAARGWLAAGNPVLGIQEQIDTFGPHYRSYRQLWENNIESHFDSTVGLIEERSRYTKEFGFSLPTREALNLLVAHQPFIEVGAGSGLWSALLQKQGVDIIPTDPRIGAHATAWENRYVESLPIQAKTAVRRWPNRNVFCSWPSLSETWLRQAARAMRPGRLLFAVWEDACADERTWDYIDSAFEPITELELIGWHYCHDRLIAWRKRGWTWSPSPGKNSA